MQSPRYSVCTPIQYAELLQEGSKTMEHSTQSASSVHSAIRSRIQKQEPVAWRELSWFQSENLKEMGARDMEKLKTSLRKNNFIQPFNVWHDGECIWILDGHHRQRAMRELEREGFALPDVLPANFVDCASRKEAAKLVLVYSSIYAKVTEEGLTDFLKDMDLDFAELRQEVELPELETDDLFKEALPDVEEDENAINTTADLPPAISKHGDLYVLSDGIRSHRLLCGDSTSADDVALLMNGQLAHLLFTDPPYNIRYAELNNEIRGNGAKNWSEVYCQDWKDEMSDADYRTFLFAIIRNAKAHLIEYAHYYVWYATPYIESVWNAFRENDVYCDAVPIIWQKEHFPQTWMRYKRLYEPCIFGGKGANSSSENSRWFGANNTTNIWSVRRDHNSTYIHPTQKPIGLAQIALENSTQPNENVLDLFGGSGSTLIAADSMKRSAFLMELEPRFVDGIVRRYIQYCERQGKTAVVSKNGELMNNAEFLAAIESDAENE